MVLLSYLLGLIISLYTAGIAFAIELSLSEWASLSTGPKPWVLTIRTDPETCKVISLSQLSVSKGLHHGDLEVQRKPTIHHRVPGGKLAKEDAGEIVELIGWSVSRLIEEMKKVCKEADLLIEEPYATTTKVQRKENDLWKQPQSSSQVAFTTDSPSQEANLPTVDFFWTEENYPKIARSATLKALHLTKPSHTSSSSDWATNRVSLFFLGDGYTQSEKDKFFEDARWLAMDVLTKDTYETVANLLNVWAVFVPSEESGVGVNSQPLNATYGLYRDGTELRGVYLSKPDVAREVCERAVEASGLGGRCDYPIVLGNDPYYGGLGGEFTIVTSSRVNAPWILRHELGHSVLNVGDEYDGSYSFGHDAAKTLEEAAYKWASWLTDPLPSDCDTGHSQMRDENLPFWEDRCLPQAEAIHVPLQSYAWYDLDQGPETYVFNTTGHYPHNLLRFSLSGFLSEDELSITIDGSPFPQWGYEPWVGLDRRFYALGDIAGGTDQTQKGLGEGQHILKFELTEKGKARERKDGEIIKQLCSAEVLEYGNEEKGEFHAKPGFVGAYPTYQLEGDITYRPTSETCTMRNNTMVHFCSVCQEALWLSVLSRISLIDGAQYRVEIDYQNNFKIMVRLELLQLGQKRPDGTGEDRGERLEIGWFRNGERVEEFQGKDEVVIREGSLDALASPLNTITETQGWLKEIIKEWSAEVKFKTAEVKADTKGHLTDRIELTIE